MTEDATGTGRKFERVLTNILPYRASIAKTQAVYDPATSDPFVPAEIIAVRDAPGTPCYVLPGRSHRHQRHLHHRALLWMPTAGHLKGHFPPCLAPPRHG